MAIAGIASPALYNHPQQPGRKSSLYMLIISGKLKNMSTIDIKTKQWAGFYVVYLSFKGQRTGTWIDHYDVPEELI